MSPLHCPGATRGGRGVSYARTIIIKSFKNEAAGERGPRRTLRSHDRRRASRKLSVHAAALCSRCAHHSPITLPRPRRALRLHHRQHASRKLDVQKVFKTRPRAKTLYGDQRHPILQNRVRSLARRYWYNTSSRNVFFTKLEPFSTKL
jgi:hypothetical protein